MSKVLSYCIIIPCYEKHALTLGSVLLKLSQYQLPFIVIDDGSSEEYAQLMTRVCEDFDAVLLVNKENSGKGSAMKIGFQYALEKGFTHGLQVDADGQHDSSSLKEIIKLSKLFPENLISGAPIYDHSIPRGRKWGRYVTHVWVWIETLGFSIEDSMCGFRSYPLVPTVKVIKSSYIGNRMDFDTEIMVKLFWRGVISKFVPIKVVYPKGGESYFNIIQDNFFITKMHTRLFFGMLLRLPMILVNKFNMTNWSQIDEKGVVFFMKLTSFLQDKLGTRLMHLVVRVICFYYYLFAFNARKSSLRYQRIYGEFCDSRGEIKKKFSSFFHFFEFAKMMLDKFSVWKGDLKIDRFNKEDIKKFRSINDKENGALFISSHFGNIELIRALGRASKNIKYNALIYTKNSQKLFNILKEINPGVEDKIIAIEKFGPKVGLELKEKVERGEWVFCMGDRVTASHKTIPGRLLGKPVDLPMGPMVLGYLLDVPIYSIHCYRDGKNYRVQCREITPDIEKTRKNKSIYMKKVAESYLEDLESVIMRQPWQWFNFYNFWKGRTHE